METIKSLEDQIWETLHTCYDPEISVDIVELGLIYQIIIKPEANKNFVTIKMTLTSPGCMMADFLIEEVHNKVAAINGVNKVEIKLVFDPPWDISRVSERGKLELGIP